MHQEDMFATAFRLPRRTRCAAIAFVQLSLVAIVACYVEGQTAANQFAPNQPSGLLVSATTVPVPVLAYLAALGDRIQKPGNERMTLSGTYTDKNGPVPATLIWQAPGNIRFDRASQPGSALTFDTATGSAPAVTPSDANILESLLDDAAESFLYGFRNGSAYRLLARRVRADDGKAANYQGPWYDVYAVTAPVKAHPGKPSRLKHYYFDGQTGFLIRTQYLDSGTRVTTEFNKWIKSNGQAIPRQIVRKENTSVVFTLDITTAITGPAQQDGIFSKH